MWLKRKPASPVCVQDLRTGTMSYFRNQADAVTSYAFGGGSALAGPDFILPGTGNIPANDPSSGGASDPNAGFNPAAWITSLVSSGAPTAAQQATAADINARWHALLAWGVIAQAPDTSIQMASWSLWASNWAAGNPDVSQLQAQKDALLTVEGRAKSLGYTGGPAAPKTPQGAPPKAPPPQAAPPAPVVSKSSPWAPSPVPQSLPGGSSSIPIGYKIVGLVLLAGAAVVGIKIVTTAPVAAGKAA
jgi:hypothetical protein